MLPIELKTPSELVRMVADRVRELRLARGWSQENLAERAGLALETYRRFERTGQVSFERLVRLAAVLDAVGGFDQLFRTPAARNLEDLEEKSAKPARKRASGRRATS